MTTPEGRRLKEDRTRAKNWKRWGPYLSERQWGTVREDYSDDGNCWNYFPHDHARSRAYRWGEDGLLGICDREGRLCMGVALWNTKDPILKERLFGLTGHQGNHGEDVKELYYYLDSTPTHSYMKALYKYPQNEYPYSQLENENRIRGFMMPEYEILDTGVIDQGYFDVMAEYSKHTPNDVLAKYTVTNRGKERATVHVLPTLWFRNVWSWGEDAYCYVSPKPHLSQVSGCKVKCDHPTLGEDQSHHIDPTVDQATPPPAFIGSFYWEVDKDQDNKEPELLFTENETNHKRLFNVDGQHYSKDAFHNYVIKGDKSAVNPSHCGTKCAAHYVLTLDPGQEFTIKVRLYFQLEAPKTEVFGPDFDEIFQDRQKEADLFYDEKIPMRDQKQRQVSRQAYAGLLWSKQFYYYVIEEWLKGDSTQPPPPASRLKGRNFEWLHLFNMDIISMPDKWEYPWYASWDLAFHMIPMADIDVQFAKDQLLLFLREWYLHPNGQLPAYEFSFQDVNPPVHAYAVLRVYKASGPKNKRDLAFLARCFHKLILNFTWWINRKDLEGRNIFTGGFLGLDNIGIFDRSKPLPTGGYLVQADATAWMAFFCSIMLEISLTLSRRDCIYEDMASKFFEHFVAIADAINQKDGIGLWNEEDGFFYDHIRVNGKKTMPLKILSMVGLVPLFSCMVLKQDVLRRHPGFYKRTRWFLNNRKDLSHHISFMCDNEDSEEPALLLSLVKKEQLQRILAHVLDENKFLSPYGIRSLSKHHRKEPFILEAGGNAYGVKYEPGESESNMFGGNSNWRGPIWFPMNYLLIENLRRYDYFFGDSLKVECPTGSGKMMRLTDVAHELSLRLSRLFYPNPEGFRPCHGDEEKYAKDPNFKDFVLFYEYFHGDSGRGCGASHQTGWTALVANLQKYIAIREKWVSSVHMAQLRKISNTGIPLDIDIMMDFSSEGEMSS